MEKAMTVKSKTKVQYETPLLKRANKEKVLSARNIRYRHAQITLLFDHWNGCSERDIDAYVFIGEQLYAVHRSMFFDRSNGDLRVFLGDGPVVFDISEAFPVLSSVNDCVEVSKAVKKLIVAKAVAARQIVIDYCVNTIRDNSQPRRLSVIMAKLKPFSNLAGFGGDGITSALIDALGFDSWGDSAYMVQSLMNRKTVKVHSCDSTDVSCHVFEANAVDERRWHELRRKDSPLGSASAKLRLSSGQLAVVTASSEDAKYACEDFIKNRDYGDVVLLVGEGQALQDQAKRVSDYLFGVDIINL